MKDEFKQLSIDALSQMDNYDNYFPEVVDRDTPLTRHGVSLTPQKRNPLFIAQFDIIVKVICTTTAIGYLLKEYVNPVLYNITTEAKASYFVFGFNDYTSGYFVGHNQKPSTSPLKLKTSGIYGFNLSYADFGFSTISQAFRSEIKNGDYVFCYEGFKWNTSGSPPPHTDGLCMVIVRCTQVPYGTILNSLSSDRFVINNIRHNINTNYLFQFEQPFDILDLSIFGKLKSDSINMFAFKDPDQYQIGIIDVPLNRGFDKQISIANQMSVCYLDGSEIKPYEYSVLMNFYVWKLLKLTFK